MIDRLLSRALNLLPKIFAALVLVFAILQGLAPQITFVDIGWHLMQGEWKLQHGASLRADWFNYPTYGQPLVDEYPFYQLVLATAWRFGGEYGLSVLAALAFAALFGLLTLYGPRVLAGAWKQSRAFPFFYGAGLLLTLFLAVPRLVIRPEIATFAGAAFTMFFLLRHRATTDVRKFWPLFICQILWTNCHSGFLLGPALVGAFGLEMTARASWAARRIEWRTLRRWAVITGITLMVCCCNPAGPMRFVLPLFHQTTMVIRAYVTEMQPWAWSWHDPFLTAMFLQIVIATIIIFQNRGAACWSFVAATAAMGALAFDCQRQLAVFAFLVPGALIGSFVFSKKPPEEISASATPRPRLRAALLVANWTLLVALTSPMALAPLRADFLGGLAARWNAVRSDQTEYPVAATRWLQEKKLPGRLFHRSEIGGWLQLNGFAGRTWCDTGFGKYTPEFIHEIGLASERPHYLPTLWKKYRPDIVVLGASAWEWPRVLKANHWRPVFYAPDGSVWVPAGRHSELPTVSNAQVTEIFRKAFTDHGMPARRNLYARQLAALQSWGLQPLALELAADASAEFKGTPLFWEMAARLFENREILPYDPKIKLRSAAFERALNAPWEKLDALAAQPEYAFKARLYRALRLNFQGKTAEAVAVLEPLPRSIGQSAALVQLARFYVSSGQQPKAVALLEQRHLFDLRDPTRYQLLAFCYSYSHNTVKEKEALALVKFFAPDVFASLRSNISSAPLKEPTP